MDRTAWILLLVMLAAPAVGQQHTLDLRDGAHLSYPDSWTVGGERFTGAFVLVTRSATPKDVKARMIITTARFSTHAKAVAHLDEVIRETPAPVDVLQIGGWPAVQRSRTATLAQTERSRKTVQGMRITTVIAAADRIVRLETFLAPAAESKLADEARAIGRSVVFPTSGTPALNEQDLRHLRASPRAPASIPGSQPVAPPAPSAAAAAPLDPPATFAIAGLGELEIAASKDGQNVVIASNSGLAHLVGGAFVPTDGNGGIQNRPFKGTGQDLTVALGESGFFYAAFIGQPPPPIKSTLAFGKSTDITGKSFNFLNSAVVCTVASGCNVDQAHIAADRFNPTPSSPPHPPAQNTDQVYGVYRNLGPLLGCDDCGSNIAAMTCSSDGGGTWFSPPVGIDGSSDYPRITVGKDGMVYVVYRVDSELRLQKYSSCSSGLVPQLDYPVTVAVVDFEGICPLAGLDRCNGINVMASPMAAVDDRDPNHVYVAFANHTAANNEDIVVADSSDGGQSWPQRIVVNSSIPARRFMPWVCTASGVAMVSWYDRRAATFARNDRTDYFAGMVDSRRGVLSRGPEFNLSMNSDPQCNSGFPGGANRDDLSTTCPPGSPVGGQCLATPPTKMDSGTPCDLRPGRGVCIKAGETCQNPGQGVPKYGDYNGNACSSGRAFFAWASAAPPPGLAAAPPAGINIFASSIQLPTLTISKIVLPSSDHGTFDLTIDGLTRARGVGNGGTSGPQSVSPGVHDVGENGASGTSTRTSAYTVAVSGDCTPDLRTVDVRLGDDKRCTFTNTRIARTPCLDLCDARLDACMEASRENGTPTRQMCMERFNSCQSACRAH